MKRLITAGATDQTVYVFIQDSASTTGGGKTGIAYNAASLVCYYVRDLGSATALSLATQTVTGAHSDGGFVEVDATNMPGIYRLDLSDAVCAASVNNVVVMLKGAAGMVPLPLEIQLGGGQIATLTGHTAQTGDAYARLGAPAGASVSADVAAVKVDTAAVKVKTDYLPSATAGAAGGVFIAGSNAATSITTALTANITGNLSGSVGSVTGAVGSVTGAVGSVTGAVGSVTGAVGSVTGAVGSVTAAVTLPTIPTNWITADGIATDAFGALELAAGAASEIAAAISIPSAATIASQVRTELTTELARIDVATSTRLATAGYTAPLDAAGTRTAVGLATANLDTQLGDLPTAAENAARVLDTETLDTGLTVRHGLELAAGSVLNKLSGGGTGTEVVRNFSDTADLATVTVDGSGNKTAITYDFST